LLAIILPRVFLRDYNTLKNQGCIPEIDTSFFDIAEPLASSHSKSIFGFYRQYTIDQHVRLNLDRHAETALNRVEAGHPPGSSVFMKYPFVYTRQAAAGKGSGLIFGPNGAIGQMPANGPPFFT
jgi:hypothetical protein